MARSKYLDFIIVFVFYVIIIIESLIILDTDVHFVFMNSKIAISIQL
jgi:hypothetical protein